MTWSCSACTLINNDQFERCQVCNTPCASKTDDERSNKRQRTQLSLNDRVGFDQRITWNPTSGETLEEWVEAVRPSQVSPSQCAWISVDNVTPNSPGYQRPRELTLNSLDRSGYQQALGKIQDIIASGGRVKAADKKECVDTILNTAKARGDTVGKWMLFRSGKFIDKVWKDIAKETADGNLGCAAKVAPAASIHDATPALICVYVKDFSDRTEVKRVLLKLQDMGLKITSGFKPDVFTTLGIESNNQWRLSPTIYSVKQVMEW